MKIYDVATYEVVHTLDYPAPVLAMGVSVSVPGGLLCIECVEAKMGLLFQPDDSVIAVGMTDGLLSTQHRKPESDSAPKVIKRRQMSYRYTIGKGAEYVPVRICFLFWLSGQESASWFQSDVVRKETKAEQLPRYDQFLRTFQHSRALDTVLVGVRRFLPLRYTQGLTMFPL